jgi:hypothetical protein
MKTSACVLIVLAMVSPLCADSVTLLSETWDGPGWSDWATVAGTNGWTGSSNPGVCLYTYDSAAVDSGRSAGPTGSATHQNADIEHSFTAPAGLTGYTLTATLWAPATNGGSSVAIYLAPTGSGNGNDLFTRVDRYGIHYSSSSNSTDYSFAQTSSPVDVRIEATNDGSTFSYRSHGDPTWIAGYSGALGAGHLSDYGQVIGLLWNDNYSNIDSIVVTATFATPEPTAITILLTGAIGLLAYAWRKRR